MHFKKLLIFQFFSHNKKYEIIKGENFKIECAVYSIVSEVLCIFYTFCSTYCTSTLNTLQHNLKQKTFFLLVPKLVQLTIYN